ncbi:MAG TPA: SusD/RagB family nutrient-binding outer membrane lipoprotein [Gemmatimonadaceae bacterium]
MKLSRIAAAAALIGLVAPLGACGDLTGLNNNHNSPTDVPPGPLFTNAARGLVARFRGANFDLTMTSLFAEHFAKVQYVDEDQYNLRTQTIDTHFGSPYSGELKDLEVVADKGMESGKADVYGPARIMQTWAFDIMTDTWGDIPYSQALKGDKEDGSILPAYDPQQEIYNGFFTVLQSAATDLESATSSSLGGADPIYNGDPAQWQKFANSLHARLALRIVNADPAKANAELTAAFAAPGGLMLSNDDNAKLVWPGDGINDNPWASNFQTRDDHRIAKPLADTLNALNDPRIAVYAQPIEADTVTDRYAGLQNGLSTAVAGTFFTTTSRPGAIFYSGATAYGTFGTSANAKTPSYLMVYAEVAFIQAEAAERGLGGLNASQAKGFYDAGIEASMEQWGITDPAVISAYLGQAGVAYQGGAAGLKQIGLQKWIALFTQGSEAWAEYRRTGNPSTLQPGPAAIETTIPRRVFYSGQEQSTNGANLAAAVARQGADEFTTRVWWDKQ